MTVIVDKEGWVVKMFLEKMLELIVADGIQTEKEKLFIADFLRILEEEGFELNEKKTRLQYNFQRQEVTGLLVNKKVSITKKLKHELEYAIYFCQKYGVVEHMSKINCNKSFCKSGSPPEITNPSKIPFRFFRKDKTSSSDKSSHLPVTTPEL